MRFQINNNKWLVGLLMVSMGLAACKTQQESVVLAEPETVDDKPSIAEKKEAELRDYQATNTRAFDLIHTSLDVRFDWNRQQLHGKAELLLRPYFYAVNQLVLDAKGFEIKEVNTVASGVSAPLEYAYDNTKIAIELDRAYSRTDTITIRVDYVAKPEELEVEGSAAITDAKGLYFINPLGEDEDKPMQIWTQGETESSSCWFPTIDSPNENMTQEIRMTVDERFTTLSNGLLISSTQNGDGTRTDHWRQTKPHAPYLAMMAVGEFAKVRDSWKELDVDYYVEPEYESDAKEIFGETPNMLEFYSNVLDYPYTWEKYSQVVVRDYVSGAMENTTATIHGEFLQRTERELLDGDNEAIIAHELFHHWFGDLVTCESWSNLPLNESFATYGEYLWMEHRHGRDAADKHGYEQMRGYLASTAQTGHLNMIRFYYGNKEEMFDAHSYNKGGRILHMLRKTIGDDAFFKGLNLYLRQNEFKSVEIHNLRLAMEEVTGMDLNWFFQLWFLDKGHPELEITHDYSTETEQYSVTIKQVQDLEEFPLYVIPLDIDIYLSGQTDRHRVTLMEQEQTFVFDVADRPQLVNVDAEKMLLGTKEESLSEAEYVFMLKNAPLYMDRFEALEGLRGSSQPDAVMAVFDALDDSYWGIRRKALQSLKTEAMVDSLLLRSTLIRLAQNDGKSVVRAEAINKLVELFGDDEGVQTIIKNAMNDRSYSVLGSALKAIARFDEPQALALAKEAEQGASGSLISSIASLYTQNGGPEQLDFFLTGQDHISDPSQKYMFIQMFGKYLKKQPYTIQDKGLSLLEDVALNEGAWWMRLSAVQVLMGLRQTAELDTTDTQAQALLARINNLIDKVKAAETNDMLLQMIGE